MSQSTTCPECRGNGVRFVTTCRHEGICDCAGHEIPCRECGGTGEISEEAA